MNVNYLSFQKHRKTNPRDFVHTSKEPDIHYITTVIGHWPLEDIFYTALYFFILNNEQIWHI